MVAVRHATQASGSNNPNKQVSVDAWNESHTLTGAAGNILAFDAGGLANDFRAWYTLEEYDASGGTDYYAALKALVAAVNLAGSGCIRLVPGKTYPINQYVTAGNGIAATDTQFLSVEGLTIYGNGAKLDVKGNFDRNVSGTYGITGLLMSRCSLIRVYDLELDGNVDQMTNSSSSTEALYPTGVLLDNCTDFVFENVNAHHFSTDGWSLRALYSDGTKTYVCRRGRLINCRGQNNGRQGLTVEGCRDLHIAPNCDFSSNGKTGGSYAGHSPETGIDIEPNFSVTSAAPNTRDQNTGDILIEVATINNNTGGTIKVVGNASLGAGETVDTVTIRASALTDDPATSNGDTLILGCRGLTFEGNQVQLYANHARSTYGADTTVTSTWRGNTVRGRGDLLRALHEVKQCLVEDNDFIVEPSGAYTGKIRNVTISNIIFSNNRYTVPKEAFALGNSGDYFVVAASGTGTPEYRYNRYSTDLTKTYLSATTAHFALAYSASALVREEKFLGTAVGTTDTFRPFFNAGFNTGGHFNRNHRLANAPGSVKPGNAAYAFVATISPALIIYDTPITADRAVSLDTTAGFIFTGAKVRVVRNSACTGAFNVNVGTGPLKALATAGNWVECEYDGSAWVETASGAL